jgi:hypothetical protein
MTEQNTGGSQRPYPEGSTVGATDCIKTLRLLVDLSAEDRELGADTIDAWLTYAQMMDAFESRTFAVVTAWATLSESTDRFIRETLLDAFDSFASRGDVPIDIINLIVTRFPRDTGSATEIELLDMIDETLGAIHQEAGSNSKWGTQQDSGITPKRALDLVRGLTSSSIEQRRIWSTVAEHWNAELDNTQANTTATILVWSIEIEPDSDGIRPRLISSLAALANYHDLTTGTLERAASSISQMALTESEVACRQALLEILSARHRAE